MGARVSRHMEIRIGASGEQRLHVHMVAVLREGAQRCPVSTDRVYLVDVLTKLVDQPRDERRISRQVVERCTLK